MTKQELQNRTKAFAISVAKFCGRLPKHTANFVFAKQLIRCSSSVGANYRAACRAKSTADFLYKLKIIEEEADESGYFLELIEELNEAHEVEGIKNLKKEANELTSIFVSSIRTIRSRQNNKSKGN